MSGGRRQDVPDPERSDFESLHADLVDGLRRDGLGFLVTGTLERNASAGEPSADTSIDA